MRRWRDSVNLVHRGLATGSHLLVGPTFEKHFQKQRLNACYFIGLLHLHRGTALLFNGPVCLTPEQSASGRTEAEKASWRHRVLLKDPVRAVLKREERKCIYFLLSLTKKWKQSDHQEAFFEVKSAFAWISALASLKTVSKVHILSSAMQFLQAYILPNLTSIPQLLIYRV